MQKIFLPNIQSLEINYFSLYSEQNIKMDFSNPVSCLLGANGIGKSTLLNCLNYAITGYINQPIKKIKSINDFVEGNSYHLKYFDGRISEMDKEFASVTVEYILNKKKILVKRKFFPSNLVIECFVDGKKCNNYEDIVVKLSELRLYNQFIFMQLKVLTFDESRDCLFWNQSILTPTLFLCMGANVSDAEEADMLAREIQKYMSRIRNLQWEISKQTTRLNTLTEENTRIFSNEQEDEASLTNNYEDLVLRINEVNNEYKDLITEKKSLTARISELTIKKLELEKDYNQIYQLLFKDKSIIEKHPLILKITQEACPICGKKHESLPVRITEVITNNECPLCSSTLHAKTEKDNDLFNELNAIDKNLHQTNSSIEEVNKRLNYVSITIEKLHQEVIGLTDKKTEIEQYNMPLSINSTSDAWNNRIKSLQIAISEVEKEKFTAMQKREELKNRYDTLCLSLQKIYQDTQVQFLPIFKKLAYAFTGLNLDMNLNSITDDGRMMFKFILQIEDSNRDNEFELSESQRFFLDIALRMSIINFVCSEEKQCTMLIDTPEGSLDIAYETNAGTMFSEYIKADNKLIVTANLNSSGLIRTLASNTGKKDFNLISMLKWANLSSVQSNHFDLFTSAIQDIESRLE